MGFGSTVAFSACSSFAPPHHFVGVLFPHCLCWLHSLTNKKLPFSLLTLRDAGLSPIGAAEAISWAFLIAARFATPVEPNELCFGSVVKTKDESLSARKLIGLFGNLGFRGFCTRDC